MEFTIQKRMKGTDFTYFIIIFVLFVCQLPDSVFAQGKTTALAKSRYSDLNNYFKIVPPYGWRIQQYTQDPRGKVAFIGPDGVELRILAKGLDYNNFEEMLDEIKGIEKKIGTNTNIEKIMFVGKPAVKRTFILKGTKILFIDFMIGNTTHNLMYSASPTKFEEYLSLVQKSIETYEPTLRGVSAEDVKKHSLAKSLRLSQIFFDHGNYDLALEYTNEGLNADPNNLKLIELKNTILKSLHETAKDKENHVDDNSNNSEETSPFIFMFWAILGALAFGFVDKGSSFISKVIIPIGGGILSFWCISEGLFGREYIAIGVVTIILALVSAATPITFLIIMEKRKK